jgi:flagellar basal-body rod protein FlgB
MKLVDSAETKLLSKALDVYSLRQKLTAANIANLDTPGYTAKEVSFEDKLKSAMSNNANAADVNPEIVDSGEKPQIEGQLLEMSDTQIRAQLVSRVLREKFDQLRTAISGTPR